MSLDTFVYSACVAWFICVYSLYDMYDGLKCAAFDIRTRDKRVDVSA